MTLNKQMIIFITSLLVLVLAAAFWLNLTNTKVFLENQLKTHAQDTATSLGLSLSSVATPEDPSSMNTMINAVFDRGYYTFIELDNTDNKTIYHRENTRKIEGIPNWFINAIDFKAPVATALVQSGWIPVGQLKVQSNPGYAYIELWKATLNLLGLFALAALIAILIALFVIKTLLKPFKMLEKQAKAIVKKEYLYQRKLPSTIEFKEVVVAMNAMVSQMKAIFDRDAKMAEKLQKMAYQDSVTGMSNRVHFEMLIDSILDTNTENLPGTFCLIRLEGLKALNDKLGYLVGDKVMCSLANDLKTYCHADKSLYARLNGSELIAVLPGELGKNHLDHAKMIAQQFIKTLNDLVNENIASISIALLDYTPGDKRGALMAKLDFAIDEALKLGQNQVYYIENQSQNSHQIEHWKDIIESAITENRFVLFQQPALDENNQVHDLELLIRMQEKDGTIRSAAYFMPAVQQLNMMNIIDQLVIKQALNFLQNSTQVARLAINLTQAIISDQSAVNELMTLIKEGPSERLAFEIPEHLIIHSKLDAWPLMEQFQSANILIGIDHFGSSFSDMHYLQNLRPDYIKLDASFTKAIDKDEKTQTYITSLVEMADRLDITIIAMSVENEEQINAFKASGIHHFQGYYFGAPSPLETTSN